MSDAGTHSCPEIGYADLLKELHQAADEYDRGHGPLHAAAANAIGHLSTLLKSRGVAQAAPTLLDIARAICRSDVTGPTCVMDAHPERPPCSDDNCNRFAQARAVLALSSTEQK